MGDEGRVTPSPGSRIPVPESRIPVPELHLDTRLSHWYRLPQQLNLTLRSSRVVEGIGPLKPGNQRYAPGANSGGRISPQDERCEHPPPHFVVVFCSSSPAQGPMAMTRTSRRSPAGPASRDWCDGGADSPFEHDLRAAIPTAPARAGTSASLRGVFRATQPLTAQ